MSNEYKDWLADVNEYKKAIREEYDTEKISESDEDFIDYLLMRLYRANVPAKEE